MTQEKKIRKHVDRCIDQYADQCGSNFITHSKWDRDHIIDIGTSILCTKWGVGPPGGGFVQAVVDNNLSEAFSRADDVNQDCIKFYLMLLYNTSYIE